MTRLATTVVASPMDLTGFLLAATLITTPQILWILTGSMRAVYSTPVIRVVDCEGWCGTQVGMTSAGNSTGNEK